MKTLQNSLLFSFIVLLLIGCVDKTPQTEVDKWMEQADRVKIIRDEFGVPHIYGISDADAVFGLLYAQCEDDFARVERNYIWATGRLAEVEGEEALYSDLRAKMFMSQEEAEAMYKESPVWLKELCNAFADGINYYLHTHPEVEPALITRFEPWMPFYFSEGSIGGDIERVSTRKIKAFYEQSPVEYLNELKEVALFERAASPQIELPEPQGSNGIAISGELTESGNTLLLINPHTSFYFRGEVHVVSKEGLNAYGAVTWGQFFVYQGFNEKTGWMHTSTYTDVIDEFVENVQQRGEELVYQYGDEWRAVESDTVLLKYTTDAGVLEKSFPIYRTHHGPVTHAEEGQWTSTALMWEPVTALQQSYIRTKQSGYEGFRKMMDLKTNSSNNTVYADAEGNIAYFHGNYIPVRDPQFDYTRPVDGSDPATDWQGLHPVEEHITLLNPKNGWLQNCNSTPFTAALEYSPKKEDYPNYMSRAPENFRGVHAIALLKDKKGHTLDGLIELAHDPFLPAFDALIPGLVSAYEAQSPGYKAQHPEMDRAIKILEEWDFTTGVDQVGMTLAHFYGTRYFREGARPASVNNSMELMQYWGEASPREERLSVFENTLNQLQEDFGSWAQPWGEVNRYQRLNGDLRQAFDDNKPSTAIGLASGRWGALAAYGARYTNNTKRIYGTRGNSFVAVVEFGEKLKAKSILAGGQSGDPNSPHFEDQLDGYANQNWKEVLYYKEDVLARAKEEYKPGQRKN